MRCKMPTTSKWVMRNFPVYIFPTHFLLQFLLVLLNVWCFNERVIIYRSEHFIFLFSLHKDECVSYEREQIWALIGLVTQRSTKGWHFLSTRVSPMNSSTKIRYLSDSDPTYCTSHFAVDNTWLNISLGPWNPVNFDKTTLSTTAEDSCLHTRARENLKYDPQNTIYFNVYIYIW
jgi:hypothetical protein